MKAYSEATSLPLRSMPEILTHPHIPKPLHGINPRTIMGQEWWDIERRRAYASNNYHCVACGIHKTQAKKHKWLEAHEYWNINYKTVICEITSIEPLCHFCHNFIHSGRLSMIVGTKKSIQEAKDILEHGLSVLSGSNLQCFPFTLSLAKNLDCKTFGVIPYNHTENESISWGDWKLIWNGKEYKSKFKNKMEWANFYLDQA